MASKLAERSQTLVDFPECYSCFDECLEKNSWGCTCLESREKSEAMTRKIGELIAARYGVEYHHIADESEFPGISKDVFEMGEIWSCAPP
ncbi:hypothetical protein AC578_8000 [Pseudocercospora eumusae]|uniref:Uncharacterized protein n=1 Tax=Pseudocercospora eumusae TaxID=321146 RepID=A0A139H0L8_9PEZI|nr:hypothetical protein AC578_8000 [Pseudocercospora eumusae]